MDSLRGKIPRRPLSGYDINFRYRPGVWIESLSVPGHKVSPPNFSPEPWLNFDNRGPPLPVYGDPNLSDRVRVRVSNLHSVQLDVSLQRLLPRWTTNHPLKGDGEHRHSED